MPRKKQDKIQQQNREQQFERRAQDFFGAENDDENGDHANGNMIENWDRASTIIEEAIKFLGETRERGNVTREVLLDTINEKLKHSYCIDFLQTQKEELVRILLLALDSVTELELIRACSVISLLMLHFGSEWKSVFRKFEPLLKRNITSSPSFTLKTANLETLCWGWFLISEDVELKQNLEYLHDFLEENSFTISKESASFFQTCLDMWCLLLSRLDMNLIIDEYLSSLEIIVAYLSSDYELNLRLAAGEALALLASIVYTVETDNEREYSIFYFNGYIEVLDVIDLLQTTNEIQNRKISKKDREKQRYTFKEVLHTLQTGESPSEEIIINGKKFTFSTWLDIKRLDSFRRLLGSGLLVHLQFNSLVSENLAISVGLSDKCLSKAEKKMRMFDRTADDKERTVHIKLGRNAKMKYTTGDEYVN